MSVAHEWQTVPVDSEGVCLQTRQAFSSYLDGALDGHTMARLAKHLQGCSSCSTEFTAWRSLQNALGELGPAQAPIQLQAMVRDALASEIGTGRHLSPLRRVTAFFQETLAPAGLRFGAGLAATLAMLGGSAWFLGTAMPVQANDARMVDVNAPKYLYSLQPTAPIAADTAFLTILVDAKVDSNGRVYDYNVVDGPQDAATRRRIEANLLESVFKPATVFGEPVPGHAMMLFTTVSARG